MTEPSNVKTLTPGRWQVSVKLSPLEAALATREMIDGVAARLGARVVEMETTRAGLRVVVEVLGEVAVEVPKGITVKKHR